MVHGDGFSQIQPLQIRDWNAGAPSELFLGLPMRSSKSWSIRRRWGKQAIQLRRLKGTDLAELQSDCRSFMVLEKDAIVVTVQSGSRRSGHQPACVKVG